jgi:nucleotide-binding universal stress UspA family protein
MIENILFPVDFSSECVGMAAYVKHVAALFNSHVTLLHVCDLASHNGFELYLRTLQEVAEEHWNIGKQKLDSFLECDFPPSEYPRVLRSGDPAQEIVKLAHSGGFDLIVMPTHAGRFRQMLLGSTTAKVLDQADCIVMTRENADTEKPRDQRHWVCGLDFGLDSERVIRLATRAAEQAHAHVSFVHVEDPSTAMPSNGGCDAARQEELERLANQTIQVVKGNVKEALLEAAQHPVADVLIIGRSPKDGLLGRMRDLTYSLIRDSPVPVLSV